MEQSSKEYDGDQEEAQRLPERDDRQFEDLRDGGVPEPLKDGRENAEENGDYADEHQDMTNDEVPESRVTGRNRHNGRGLTTRLETQTLLGKIVKDWPIIHRIRLWEMPT